MMGQCFRVMTRRDDSSLSAFEIASSSISNSPPPSTISSSSSRMCPSFEYRPK